MSKKRKLRRRAKGGLREIISQSIDHYEVRLKWKDPETGRFRHHCTKVFSSFEKALVCAREHEDRFEITVKVIGTVHGWKKEDKN